MTCYVVLPLLPDSPGNKYTPVLVALTGTFRKKHLQHGIKKEGEYWLLEAYVCIQNEKNISGQKKRRVLVDWVGLLWVCNCLVLVVLLGSCMKYTQ